MLRPRNFADDHAIAALVRAGTTALPDTDALAAVHLQAIDAALRERAAIVTQRHARPRRAQRWSSRRAALAVAAGACLALPSMAIAGVLPEPVQRAASKAAAIVGVALPAPASQRAEERTSDVPDRAPAAHRESATAGIDPGRRADENQGRGLGETTRGTVPGKPEPGEQRGNRFGQVESGPDNGKAAASRGAAKGAKAPKAPAAPEASSQRAAAPAVEVAETAPASTPAAAAGRARGNGNGNAAGKSERATAKR